MSTQPFGQQPAFGAPAAGTPAPPVEEAATKSGKTVVIAVAAGVVSLGVLGGAAALALSGGDDPADAALPPAPVASTEPTVAPTTEPAKPLPTAAVQGRNVFLPLVEEDAAAAGEGDVVADPQPAVATTAPTAAPTVAPPPVVQTISVPGPTVVETVEVPGPTTTVSVPSSTETVSTFVHDVTVASVQDPAVVDSPATFVVNDETIEVEKDELFKTIFVYRGYDPVEGLVSFSYGSDLWTVPVGTEIGLGRP